MSKVAMIKQLEMKAKSISLQVVPGERDTLIPGEREKLIPGETGEKKTLIAGERNTLISGDRKTLIHHQKTEMFQMNSSMSSAAILDHDWLEILRPDSETSSGYGSTSDDCGSLYSFPSASEEDLTHPSREYDVMKFTSTNTLCDSLKYIMSMPELCDVTFLVGKHKTAVYGIRAIISARSRIFYELLLKHIRAQQIGWKLIKSHQTAINKLVIPVLNYDVDIFRSLMQFIHCGTIRITLKTVTGLMCAADQFELEDLRRACWNYVEFSLQCKTAFHLLRQANRYNDHQAANRIISRIHRFYNSEDIRYLKYGPRLETTV